MSQDMTTRVNTEAWTRAMNMVDRRLVPEAVAETLNTVADRVATQARHNAESRLIIRTKFTTRGIKQDRHARGFDVTRMFSRAVAKAPYLEIQESGGTQTSGAGKKIPIPTVVSRISGNISRSIQRRFRLDQVGNIGPGYGGTTRFFIGKPRGGNRNFGMYFRSSNNKRLKMVRSMEHESVRVRATNFFSDATQRWATQAFIEATYSQIAQRKIREIEQGARE